MDLLPVHHELDGWASRFPERIAVLDGRQALSYRELAAASSRLGHALRHLGVGRQERVVFCLQRSVHCLTALMGTLRSGAVYVPLDPKTPPDRGRSILSDCSPRALLCDRTTLPLARELAAGGCPIVCLGEPPAAGDGFGGIGPGDLHHFPEAPPADPGGGNDLAYILYTSGSTGRPKGVMVSHCNVRSYIDWAVRRFSIGPADRILGTAPFHFDMSVFDLFCTLRSGATLCIASESLTLFPAKLVEFMERQGVTLWKGVSSLLMYLARAGVLRPGRLPSLGQVLFGGEVLPTRWLIEWLRAFPEKEFYNVYGPTETTGISLCHRVEQRPPGPEERVPIGAPCTDTYVYLLDGELRPVEDGEAGELFIGGAGVASGYLNDPEKTARAFLPDPFRTGARLYRTGDLARRRSDGIFEFVGRRDHQVKIMGYRVELGEIEQALHALPGVRDAAALVVPAGESGLEELIAFLEGEAEPAAAIEALRQRLPAYMVPRRLLPVGSLPRCGRGKIDRHALHSLLSRKAAEHADG